MVVSLRLRDEKYGSRAGAQGMPRRFMWAEQLPSHGNDKWDEQVLRVGETLAHEEASAAPHRGSPMQAVQG
jgi:hypothetical protein